jgi:hypothetical protein
LFSPSDLVFSLLKTSCVSLLCQISCSDIESLSKKLSTNDFFSTCTTRIFLNVIWILNCSFMCQTRNHLDVVNCPSIALIESLQTT